MKENADMKFGRIFHLALDIFGFARGVAGVNRTFQEKDARITDFL